MMWLNYYKFHQEYVIWPALPRPDFLSGAELRNLCMDFFNFWHTHSLADVDVPFEILST